MSTATTGPDGPVTHQLDRAQYGLAAVLALVEAFTVYDATTLNVGFGDPVGPRVFPYAIGTVTIVLALLLAVATARGDTAEAEGGEDIDLTTPPARLGGVEHEVRQTVGADVADQLLDASCPVLCVKPQMQPQSSEGGGRQVP